MLSYRKFYMVLKTYNQKFLYFPKVVYGFYNQMMGTWRLKKKNLQSLGAVLSSVGMTWLHKASLLSAEALAAGSEALYTSSPISVEGKLL